MGGVVRIQSIFECIEETIECRLARLRPRRSNMPFSSVRMGDRHGSRQFDKLVPSISYFGTERLVVVLYLQSRSNEPASSKVIVAVDSDLRGYVDGF